MNPFSRRAFLKGLGVGALTSAAQPFRAFAQGAQGADSQTLGPDAVEITLEINGAPRTLKVEPRVTLLDALRNRLDQTGTKLVCDRGTCGGCSVLLDGRAVYGCMVLAVDAVGRKITTIEGIGTPEKPDPVQRAFVECDALMCGFCTPGFVVATRALLNETPKPTREQIVRGLSGNLCRCGTYPRIIDAVEKAAGA